MNPIRRLALSIKDPSVIVPQSPPPFFLRDLAPSPASIHASFSVDASPLTLEYPTTPKEETISKVAVESLNLAMDPRGENLRKIFPKLLSCLTPSPALEEQIKALQAGITQENEIPLMRNFLKQQAHLLSKIQYLDLSRLNLTELPKELFLCTGLAYLHLEGNHLKTIPPEIGFLKKLCVLNLKCNQLESLPYELGYLHNLTSLELQKNRLKALPETIGYLQKLQNLCISGNDLSFFPPSLCQLRRLEKLEAFANNLSSLPLGFHTLSNLKQLNLAANFFVEIPQNIPSNLEELVLLANPCLR